MDGRQNVVNLTLDDVLDGARRGFKRTTFQDKCALSVKFSGEAGLDDGGPTRRFMRFNTKALRDSHHFGGPEDVCSFFRGAFCRGHIQTERVVHAGIHIVVQEQ